ncbi:twin-arginine translocation signal domain-containing protein [Shigella flexneri]
MNKHFLAAENDQRGTIHNTRRTHFQVWNRRRFIKGSMAMAAVCGTSGIASPQAAFAADSDIADGQTQRFDFSILQSMAHDFARTAWRGAPRPLPDTLATMTPQAYNEYSIRRRKIALA